MNEHISTSSSTPQAASGADSWIKASSTADFQADVIEASKSVPVLVDFWAEWCGPCRQLTPALEETVNALGGAIRLVKIDVDQNQALAGQMGIKSIPAVFAFANGRPVDGFMGALPPNEVRRFAEKIIAAAGAEAPAPDGSADRIDAALKEAAALAESHDFENAANLYGMIIDFAPDTAEAVFGLAGIHVHNKQTSDAETLLESLSEAARKDQRFAALKASIALLNQSAGLAPIEALEASIAANPEDHQARHDLALAYNLEGRRLDAARTLVELMKKDREWNEDGARRKLLEFFEAWGPRDQATIDGRRLLSAVLFS